MNNGVIVLESGTIIGVEHKCAMPDVKTYKIKYGTRFICNCGKRYRYFPPEDGNYRDGEVPAQWREFSSQ